MSKKEQFKDKEGWDWFLILAPWRTSEAGRGRTSQLVSYGARYKAWIDSELFIDTDYRIKVFCLSIPNNCSGVSHIDRVPFGSLLHVCLFVLFSAF